MPAELGPLKSMPHEIEQLLSYLEQRGLTEPEACAVMGEALTSLMGDDDTKRKFLRVLESRFFQQ